MVSISKSLRQSSTQWGFYLFFSLSANDIYQSYINKLFLVEFLCVSNGSVSERTK